MPTTSWMNFLSLALSKVDLSLSTANCFLLRTLVPHVDVVDTVVSSVLDVESVQVHQVCIQALTRGPPACCSPSRE